MTNVTITRKNGHICQVECDGHTFYGEEGEDIVCAALSSVVQTAVLGVMRVAAVNVDLKRDDKRGYLKFVVPGGLTQAEQGKVDAILETMLLGIADLNEGFSDFIELEVKG